MSNATDLQNLCKPCCFPLTVLCDYQYNVTRKAVHFALLEHSGLWKV